MDSKTLVVIPARGGSKEVPDKNIRLMHGKPLISYTTEIARRFFPDEHVCVSTDSEKIKTVVEGSGLEVPFLRPAELATDTAGTYEVLLHAINFFEKKGKFFDRLFLMQPTSPFRTGKHLSEMEALYNAGLDMVVSVGISRHNPYFSLVEEEGNGYLRISKKSGFARRQDCPPVYFYNGSMYLVNIASLKKDPISSFTKVKKYIMEEKYSLDIDTPLDWTICETLLEKGLI